MEALSVKLPMVISERNNKALAMVLLHMLFKLAWRLRLIVCSFFGVRLTGAQVLVFYKQSLLLINNSYRAGMYLPGGGMTRNELPVEAAARELREETGTKVSVSELISIGTVDYKIGRVDIRDHLFYVKLDTCQPPYVDGKEVTRAGYFDISHARTLVHQDHLLPIIDSISCA